MDNNALRHEDVLPCPYQADTHKKHNPVLETQAGPEEFLNTHQVRCTCGAKGPLSFTGESDAVEPWNSLPRHSEPETHGRWRYHVEWFNHETAFQEWQDVLVGELKGEIVTVQCVGCNNDSGTQTSIMTTVIWREPFTDRPITNEKETQP